jgi:hypothetical protein
MSEGERKYTGFAAIYQLEQEKLKRERSSEQPDERPDAASTPPDQDRSDQQVSSPESQRESATSSRVEADSQETGTVAITGQRSSPTSQPAPTTGRRATSPRPGRTSATRPTLAKAAPVEDARTSTDSTTGTIETHALKWKQVYRLNKGEINVMKVMFRLTYEHGESECYIKVPEVAEAAQLKKRRCQYVIRGLETLGFLERIEDYDPSKRLGTKYRVRLKPSRSDI